mmetsp:Transcript_17222/g.37378  ORF Transcript_17222/g.37378 Transcript_17222/m.37378 type:complete len:214 (-) Transcript_17222:45-686(-)
MPSRYPRRCPHRTIPSPPRPPRPSRASAPIRTDWQRPPPSPRPRATSPPIPTSMSSSNRTWRPITGTRPRRGTTPLYPTWSATTMPTFGRRRINSDTSRCITRAPPIRSGGTAWPLGSTDWNRSSCWCRYGPGISTCRGSCWNVVRCGMPFTRTWWRCFRDRVRFVRMRWCFRRGRARRGYRAWRMWCRCRFWRIWEMMGTWRIIRRAFPVFV